MDSFVLVENNGIVQSKSKLIFRETIDILKYWIPHDVSKTILIMMKWIYENEIKFVINLYNHGPNIKTFNLLLNSTWPSIILCTKNLNNLKAF